ncbi:MAG: hypothetical protein KC635_02040 [Myxococcales bacterium]|nr:hypothetical protein [Myxococcales bacterium]
MTQAWYNIVVVGTDLTGLIYAALAARLGYRVAVVGQGARPNLYRRAGHTFARRPERFYGMASSPVVARVLGELSLAIEMKNRPHMIDPTLQVVLPGRRFDVSGHRKHWERELDRELPGALEAADRFEGWARTATQRTNELLASEAVFPPGGMRGRALYKRSIEGIEDLVSPQAGVPWSLLGDAGLEAMVKATVTHLSGIAPDAASPLATARLWSHLRAGLYRIQGGLEELKAVFIRKIREQSSDYRPDDAISEVVVKRGKVRAVVLGERDESFGCELVVGNVEPRHFFQLFPREDREDEFHAQLTGVEPGGWFVTLNLGVDPKVIPRGMGPELVAVRDPGAPLVGGNCLWISRPGAAGPGAEGRPSPGVLQVTTIVPTRGPAPTMAATQRAVDEALGEVRRIVPWLDQHLEVVDVPAIVPDPGTGRPMLDPDELAPIYAAPRPQTLGVSAFSGATAYRNVLLASDLLFSGLGFEGVCLAALQTLHLTRRMVRLKSSLRSERTLS